MMAPVSILVETQSCSIVTVLYSLLKHNRSRDARFLWVICGYTTLKIKGPYEATTVSLSDDVIV